MKQLNSNARHKTSPWLLEQSPLYSGSVVGLTINNPLPT